MGNSQVSTLILSIRRANCSSAGFFIKKLPLSSGPKPPRRWLTFPELGGKCIGMFSRFSGLGFTGQRPIPYQPWATPKVTRRHDNKKERPLARPLLELIQKSDDSG